MDELKLYLPIKVLSANKAYTVIRGRIQMSREMNSFKAYVRKLLYSDSDKVKNFAESCGEYCLLCMTYRFWIPKKDLYTKKGRISKTSLDVDNGIKYLTDAIFRAMQKYNPKVNDAFVMEFSAIKCEAVKQEYGVTFLLEKANSLTEI